MPEPEETIPVAPLPVRPEPDATILLWGSKLRHELAGCFGWLRFCNLITKNQGEG